MIKLMRNTFPQRLKKYRIDLFFLLCLYTVTIEMRPGRVYYVAQFMLFRNSLTDFLLFFLLLGLTVWSLQVYLLNKSALVRYGFLALLCPFLLLSLSYRFITGYNYAYADAHTVLNNVSLLPEVLENFRLQLLMAFAATAFILLLLYLLTKRTGKIYRGWHAAVVIPVAIISFLYINSSLGVIDDMPVLYRVPISTALAASHKLPVGERHKVSVQPKNQGVKHLFLIVDESITGSTLSLNGNAASTTPYLKSVEDSLINFGVASAYTNYSAGTNIALIGGLRQEELPDLERKALTNPSIFQYAKQAGYTTYFIDAQLGKGALQNFMALDDLKSIDHFVQPSEEQPDIAYYNRDYAVADLLIKLSNSDRKVFAYVNKAGAHWPYARTYHPDSTFFTPVLAATSMVKNHQRSLNTYYNAIRWTVDGFWKKLMSGIRTQDSTFILYTSDHGQDLSGNGISITHARTIDTAPIEANVPLWCLDKANYTKAFRDNSMQAEKSHLQIFPTLLLLQGYQEDFVRQRHGPTLFDPLPPQDRYFLSGDVFGRGPHALVKFGTQ